MIHSVRSPGEEKRENVSPRRDGRESPILRLSRLVRGALLRGRCRAKRKKGEPIRFGSPRRPIAHHVSRAFPRRLSYVRSRSTRGRSWRTVSSSVVFLLFFFFVSLTNSWLAVRISSEQNSLRETHEIWLGAAVREISRDSKENWERSRTIAGRMSERSNS